MKSTFATMLAAVGALTLASPAFADEVRPDLDLNGDGMLDLEEYVMAQAQPEMNVFDANDDEIMTVEEFTAKGNANWRAQLLRRFNADGNDVMDVNELVEMCVWMFGNTDKDQSGMLTLDELPGHMKRRSQ